MVQASVIRALLLKLGDPRMVATAEVQIRQMGTKIIHDLHRFVESTADDKARDKALSIAVDMADPQSLPLFRRMLSSPRPAMRSLAAQGLYRQNSTDAAAALVQTIDDNPDMLRRESTPSVAALMEMGLPSLVHVLPLLDAPGRDTRLRAQAVLMRITRDDIKTSMGSKAVKADADQAWNALWEKNGNYHIDLPVARRQHAIAAWTQWANQQSRE